MKRRLTEVFPFLIPLRRWQRKTMFYIGMRFDGNDYADRKTAARLSTECARISSLLINERTGYDISFQYNKVHNLQLASRPINGLLIFPGQTFSFWHCVRRADKATPYKDGLVVMNGKVTSAKGGGLCQLSTMLYRLLSQTELTEIERHGHTGERLAPAPDEVDVLPDTDATVSEGWLDLKFKNETPHTYQIEIAFDGTHMHGVAYSDEESLLCPSVADGPTQQSE